MDDSFVDNSEAEMLQPEYSKRIGERHIVMKSKDFYLKLKTVLILQKSYQRKIKIIKFVLFFVDIVITN